MIKHKKTEIQDQLAPIADRLPQERVSEIVDEIDDWLERRPWWLRLLLNRVKDALVELVKQVIQKTIERAQL